MPFEITASGPDIPDGTYPATLESVTEESGQFGLMRKWLFLVEYDGKNAQGGITPLTVYTSANTGTGSKSYAFLVGLTGKELTVGERIEDPTGTKALVQIVRNKKGFPTVDAVLPIVEPQQVLPGVPR